MVPQVTQASPTRRSAGARTRMLEGMTQAFSDDIAIDLGTANTLVHVIGRGIIIDEPSMVAVRTRSGMREVVAVGLEAKAMVAAARDVVEPLRPLRDGVIADFQAAEAMLRSFIRRAKSMLGFRRPRILVCVPAGATSVERRAVYETAATAGARRVYLVEEPVAASIGAGLAIEEPAATMVVDIGGGTTDVAVLSLGEVVLARSLRCAGNTMDDAIQRYVRRNHDLAISAASAERIKIEAAAASPRINGRAAEIRIRGRDLKHGRTKTVTLGTPDVAIAIADPIGDIAEFVRRAIEDVPPDIACDIRDRGISLSGGGSLLHNLDSELQRRVGITFHVPEHPLQCVVTGTARILESLDTRAHLLIKP